MNRHKLFGKGIHGTNVWEIWSELNVIHIFANGGRYTEIIEEGKAGRTIEQQVTLRIDARVRGKLDGGFKYTEEETKGEITNQLGLMAPMLATPYKDSLVRGAENFVQPKLDGHRCLINADGAYSRRGKVIETIPEILADLDIPEGMTLDGELYYHGVPLQTIASWAKRRQADTLKLEYHVYDIMLPDTTYLERLLLLQLSVKETDKIKLVKTARHNKDIDPMEYCAYYKGLGYEGGILRLGESRYEVGRRSKSLIKLKSRYDEEFECIDVIPSREGLGILVLKTKEGKEFKTLAPGDNYTKKKTLDEKVKYIGKFVTCEFADWTIEKKPFHCVATRWRKDI